MKQDNKCVLIVGAGDAIGYSIGEAFARAGYVPILARRNAEALKSSVNRLQDSGFKAHGIAMDAREEIEVINLFSHIKNNVGELSAVVFNIGANVPMRILDTTATKFRKI